MYAVRSHAEHVRNIFTGLSGCKLLFNFTLLRLNLSTVTEIPLLRLYDEKSPARRQNPQFKCNYLATWELNKNPVSCISVISLYSSLHLASLKCHGSRAIYDRLEKKTSIKSTAGVCIETSHMRKEKLIIIQVIAI